MTRTEVITKIKELNISTDRPAHQMKTEVLEALIAQHGTVEMKVSVRGRKPNPSSARQHKLMMRQVLLEQGIAIPRGRKPNQESARQQRLAAWAARAASGEVIRRGRPKKNSTVVE
jgi:hypothetical protein